MSLTKSDLKFDWNSYEIPDGIDEIYLVFKIPGSSKSTHHFLMSCFPSAEISGFKLFIEKKY